MNTFVKFLVFSSIFIANTFGFSTVSIGSTPSFRNTMLRPANSYQNTLVSSKMSLFDNDSKADRRDILKIATVALGSILLPTYANADEELDISWTEHKGPFDENNLKEYTKTDSGLLYKDVAPGSGPMPNEGDAVKIHMVGYIFETGEKWANTYKGIPSYQSVVRAGVRPNQKYMKGLNEGVKTMKKGGKRILVIPAYLAYNYTEMLSEKNPGMPVVPGGSSLVCYVEVLDFKKLE